MNFWMTWSKWANVFSWSAAAIAFIWAIIFFSKKKKMESLGAFIVSLLSLLSLFFNLQGYSVSGKISLEDNHSPEQAFVKFYKHGGGEFSARPNKDGVFQTELSNGSYRILVQHAGYFDHEVSAEKILEETNLNPIVLKLKPKTVTVLIKDKSGNPYSNLKMAVGRVNKMGDLGTYQTDDKGMFKTKPLEYSSYGLILAENSDPRNNFVWNIGLQRIANFKLVSRTDTYEVILPKIIYANSYQQIGAQQINAPNYRFVAQFLPASKVNFCGVGLGIIGTDLPNKIQIRPDDNGKPGLKELFVLEIEPQPSISVAATGVGNEGVFADFCSKYKAPLKLPSNGVWVVGEFKQVSQRFTVLGQGQSELISPMTSTDGLNWNTMLLPESWNMVWAFVSE